MSNSTYLNNIDEEKVTALLTATAENSKYFEDTVMGVVTAYSANLDSLMEAIYNSSIQEEAISTSAVERYYAELAGLLYFMSTEIEKLNIYNDMSKAAAREVYNKAYLSSSSEKDAKGKSVRTVAENTSIAEMSSQYETVVNQVYEHAYRTIRVKMDAANEMVTTLKNILKKRMSDDYINNQISMARVHAEELDG